MVTIRSALQMVHEDIIGSYPSSVDKRNTAGNINACTLFSRLKFQALEININLALKFKFKTGGSMVWNAAGGPFFRFDKHFWLI